MVHVFVSGLSLRIMCGRMILLIIERMTIVHTGYSRSLMSSAVRV